MFRVMRRAGYLASILLAWQAAPASGQELVNVSNPAEIDGPAAVSVDGRFVLFETASPLAPQDTNRCLSDEDSPGLIGCIDLYLRDLLTHQTTLVSQGTDGTIGNGNSTHGSMSADGRFALFVSTSIGTSAA